ncbi:MAG: DHHA1 domain-containing protein [Halobacteriales archaeon]
MTEYLAPAEPYTWSFDAEIERINGTAVTLDRTYFYAEGGGQPADRGAIADRSVETVQKRNGDIVHILDDTADLTEGQTVVGQIDPEFRRYCMRAHTASHALYGAGRRLLDDLGYGGFGIDEEKVRVDFTTTTDINDDVLLELERLTNRVVWESRPVSWEQIPPEEAHERDDVAFNTKTEEGVMADADTIRIVTIEDWDVAACGGTHVSTTNEIGPVTVLDRSNPGEGLSRVEFTVGPQAIERRKAEKAAAKRAARILETSVEGLPDAAERLQAETEELQAEIESLRAEMVDAQLADLEDDIVEKNGRHWLVGTIDGLDANDLGDRAKELVGERADVVALVGQDGRTFVAVAAEGADANEIIADVTDEFGGGGGGSPAFAQGGGIDAEPGTVVGFLRD